MEINSFEMHPYRIEYLKRLKNLPGPNNIRFCQPEPACFQCMHKPIHIPQPHIHAALSGIQAQLFGADGATIAVNEPVQFNSIVTDPSSNLSYSGATSSFVIRKPGNYYVSWWVNADGAGGAGFVMFSVVVTNGQFISASSPFPLLTIQLNGSALLTINETILPANVRLINTSGDTVTYGTSTIQANMTIVEVTNLPFRL